MTSEPETLGNSEPQRVSVGKIISQFDAKTWVDKVETIKSPMDFNTALLEAAAKHKSLKLIQSRGVLNREQALQDEAEKDGMDLALRTVYAFDDIVKFGKQKEHVGKEEVPFKQYPDNDSLVSVKYQREKRDFKSFTFSKNGNTMTVNVPTAAFWRFARLYNVILCFEKYNTSVYMGPKILYAQRQPIQMVNVYGSSQSGTTLDQAKQVFQLGNIYKALIRDDMFYVSSNQAIVVTASSWMLKSVEPISAEKETTFTLIHDCPIMKVAKRKMVSTGGSRRKAPVNT